MKLLKKDTIIKHIAEIRETGASYQKLLHRTVCQVFMHAAEHKDVSLIAALANSLPEMTDTKGLARYLAEFGPVKLVFDEKEACWKATQYKTDGKTYKPYDVDGVVKTPFWTWVKANQPKPMAFADLLSTIASRIKAASDAHDEGRFVGDYNDVLALQALVEGATVLGEEDGLKTAKAASRDLKAAWADANPVFPPAAFGEEVTARMVQ